MPTGPKGEKRPADVIGNAIMVAKIATGEIEDTVRDPAKELHRKGGLKGGVGRAKALSSEQRREIALKAAAARWKK
jgi:hypothetical protein